MQNVILEPIPQHGCYLTLEKLPEVSVLAALHCLQQTNLENQHVLGIGAALVLADSQIKMPVFPALAGAGVNVPSTQGDLWIWLRGNEVGALTVEAQMLVSELSECFDLVNQTYAFMHGDCRDLTGYEDGTENPEGDKALAAGFVSGQGAGIDGSTYAAVQQWVHDLPTFAMHSQTEKDHMIGRRLSDNEELDDAPTSAHVKRTAQEQFEPEAFVLRRSMPWAESSEAGLMFVAFGHSTEAYEAQLRNMVGENDGVVDALFRFSKPVSGGYYWCPPRVGTSIDWSALNMDNL